MPEPVRLFIAVPLPESVKSALLAAGAKMARSIPPGIIRWVKAPQMHLTLRFLGDTAVAQLPPLQTALDRLAAGQAPIKLQLNTLGAFPNRRRPRVIWVGLDGDLAALSDLKRTLDAHLVPLGWSAEKRPFSPHITIGRVKDQNKVAQLNWQIEVEKLVVDVSAVHLIKSELRPSGPIYTLEHQVHLKEAN